MRLYRLNVNLFRMHGGEIVRKSKVKKMKLATVLMLTTVLIPNIAYADEEIDNTEQSLEAETAVNPNEVETTEDASTEEPVEETTEEEPVTESTSPNVNAIEDDIETSPGTTNEKVEESVDDSADTTTTPESDESTETETPILEPAEPEENPAENIEETPEEAPSEEVVPEETPEETPEEPVQDEVEQEVPVEEDTGTTEQNNGQAETEEDVQQTPEEEPAMPELPTEPIEPLEPNEPAEPTESNETEPAAENAEPEQDTGTSAVEQPVEETVEEPETANPETAEDNSTEEAQPTASQQTKKLYRYDFGDIMNGITLNEESIQEDLSTLDQRVTRVMSSKIIEKKDLTEEQKLKLKEQVKSETTSSYDGETLPNTGEEDSTSYAAAGLLAVVGAALLFVSRKFKTDN